MDSDGALTEVCQTFVKLTSKPENYLSVQENIATQAKALTKVIYDLTQRHCQPLKGASALPELIIQQFEEEQVWQQLELQNQDGWRSFLPGASRLLAEGNNFHFPIALPGDELQMDDDDDEDGSEDRESIAEDQLEQRITKKKKKTKKPKENFQESKGSIVDDKFFKLKELEAFLNSQDKEEMNRDKNTKKSKKSSKYDESSEEDEEEEIDLFDNWDSNDEGIEKMDEDDESKTIKYKDFFDKKSDDEGSEAGEGGESESDDLGFSDDSGNQEELDSDQDVEEAQVKDPNKKKKSVRFSMEQPGSEDGGDEDMDTDDAESPKKLQQTEDLSEFQLRQQRLGKKISHLENNMFEEKAWPMKGEVVASSRPQNSLLEEVVDFDMTSRPAPIITEETTLKLQDIIIQRIKDKAWDDVERKIKPVQEVQEFKKQLVLDQEKSKLSLAQVYEKEYIKQREALDPDADEKPEEEPKEHEEVRTLMSALFAKLDALGQFHYTPKMAAPELRIVSNLPAVSMEEVAPLATSDATLLAPEEIKAKPKGDIIGKSERTNADKNRERRQKKLRQRQKEHEREKREKMLDKTRPGLGNKYSRAKASKLIDKVTKARNVDKMETLGDHKSLKSSSAFFTQLQEEVSSSINSKLKASTKKTKNPMSAKKMKL